MNRILYGAHMPTVHENAAVQYQGSDCALRFAMVRNPFGFYFSLWSFLRDETKRLSNPMAAFVRDLKRTWRNPEHEVCASAVRAPLHLPPMHQIPRLTSGSCWAQFDLFVRTLLARDGGVALYSVLDRLPVRRLGRNLTYYDNAYPRYNQKTARGLLTFYYQTLLFNPPLSSLPTMQSLESAHDRSLAVDIVVRMEESAHVLWPMLARRGMDDMASQLLSLRHERMNASPATSEAEVTSHYSADTLRMVYSAELFIFKHYYTNVRPPARPLHGRCAIFSGSSANSLVDISEFDTFVRSELPQVADFGQRFVGKTVVVADGSLAQDDTRRWLGAASTAATLLLADVACADDGAKPPVASSPGGVRGGRLGDQVRLAQARCLPRLAAAWRRCADLQEERSRREQPRITCETASLDELNSVWRLWRSGQSNESTLGKAPSTFFAAISLFVPECLETHVFDFSREHEESSGERHSQIVSANAIGDSARASHPALHLMPHERTILRAWDRVGKVRLRETTRAPSRIPGG